jgi:hypothetical protein
METVLWILGGMLTFALAVVLLMIRDYRRWLRKMRSR